MAVTACQPLAPSPTGSAPPPVTSTPELGLAGGIRPSVATDALKGVNIQAWYPWLGVEASLFESAVTEFNRTNEWGILVTSSAKNNYTELYDQVTTSLPSPDRPQLVIALPEQAQQWDAGGYVTDLTGYLNDSQYGLTRTEQDDFPVVFLAQDAIAGRRLGMPAERTARFIVYNSTWAKALGFEAAPRNAGEFREQACRAHQGMLTDSDKSNDAQGGWLVDTSAMTFLSWMMAFGGGVLEGDGFRFLTPKNLTALTYVKQLYDDGCAWTALPGGDAPAAFAGRKALFATASLEELASYARAMGAANNGDDWTVLGFPGPVQDGLLAYGSSYVLLKSTPERQLAAWLFVRWLLSTKNQTGWVTTTGLFPLRTSSLASLTDYQNSHPQWAAAVDLLPQAQIQPQLASWRQVRVMIGDGFDSMFRSNTPSGRVAEILAIMGTAAGDLSP
jgi:multiple sugar transport system substrate-binding protein